MGNQVSISECIKNKLMSHVEMAEYKCHKHVHGLPMTAGVYFGMMGKDLPEGKLIDDKGYIVCYSRGKPDEYVSWSPKKALDDGYKLISTNKYSNDIDSINNFEIELQDLIDSASNIPLVTVYGVVKLIASDMLNKASMARVMLMSGGNK